MSVTLDAKDVFELIKEVNTLKEMFMRVESDGIASVMKRRQDYLVGVVKKQLTSEEIKGLFE